MVINLGNGSHCKKKLFVLVLDYNASASNTASLFMLELGYSQQPELGATYPSNMWVNIPKNWNIWQSKASVNAPILSYDLYL